MGSVVSNIVEVDSVQAYNAGCYSLEGGDQSNGCNYAELEEKDDEDSDDGQMLLNVGVLEEEHSIVQQGVPRETTWIPSGEMDILINATVHINATEGAQAMGQLIGKNMRKMPLHVKVKSAVPVVVFFFPFPVYYLYNDISHFQCERPNLVAMDSSTEHYGNTA